ncbi:MAG TPA: SIS domain-containing protein [Xanthobacteraceae bacterium]
MSHASEFLGDVLEISRSLDANIIEKMALELASLRQRGGRLFLLGLGGSAGNCSHAVNDFRKLCGIEAYTPTDNVCELTARANDEGLDTIFTGWLEISRLGANDAVLVFSVGGGDSERNISTSIVKAVDLAKARGARVLGVVGRDSGHTARCGDVVIIVPTVEPKRLTPLAEAFQAVVWHCLVSHPVLQVRATKW